MRIVLIQCPVWGTREPPLSIVQLSGCLKAKGHEVKSFDLNNYLYKNRAESFKNLWAWEQSAFWYRENDVRRFFDDIESTIDSFLNPIFDYNPQMAGFSIASSSYQASREIAKRLIKRKPDLKIVFGGQMFINYNHVRPVFEKTPAHFVIGGEADDALPELAGVLEKSNDISACKGIYTKKNSGVTHTGERTEVQSLESLPYMDFTDLKIEDYDDTVHIPLMASRGCIWNCAFCSSKSFRNGYKYMSGERVHQEITFHKMTQNRELSHVDFMDLVFNGNMPRVKEFCELMIKYPPYPSGGLLEWTANAVITPALTPDILKLMHEAGCEKLIFGIESGSQRVLGLMNKKYKISDAKKVIKDAAEAGIGVTANFMFGFPGESEEDFECTLDFIRDTGGYLERAYPSRTYCALEEFSYLHAHTAEFSIKMPCNHHLYWESCDGKNTYPVRLKRCQRFEELCGKLGVKVDCGVKTPVEMDEWFNLGHYYEFKGEYGKALDYFKKYEERDPENKVVKEKLKTLAGKNG